VSGYISPIVIREIMNGKERKDAIDYIHRTALTSHGCSPPPPAEHIFAAFRDGEICGTVGMDLSDGVKPFRLEQIYRFDPSAAPLPFDRSQIVQLGSWRSSAAGISVPLMYIVTLAALRRGKFYGLTEAKERIRERIEEIGIRLHLIRSEMDLGFVPPQGRPYYVDEPQPKLYILDLLQKEAALRTAVQEAVAEKRICLDGI
jgi:hypothetical protein